ncbi:hypothetical protein BC827DRAFT_955785 [Russula dissimulans]|nr:hypothetical protein BC827DRAFT_955785 [Russula dissimulans]
MLSELSPLFKDIDTYYSEINVSLYAEEECLKKIRRSFRVTPDDKRRWEYIRNACREASDLLTSERLPPSPSTPPNTPQPANNKAPRNIKALAQTVINARRRLIQVHRDIAEFTQQPQFSLLRLQSEYESGDRTCRHKINGLLEFSERFLASFPQVPPLDDFRDHLLPSAAASSDQILKEIGRQVKSSRYAVLSVFPELKNQFDLFDHSLPIANTSMQHMYHALQGMVRPLRQQDDALRPAQLREGQRHFANLGQQWGAQLQSTSGAVYFPP